MKPETIEEFKARGGIVYIANAAPKKYNRHSILEKDEQLKALNQLHNMLTDPKKKADVSEAIEVRTELLTQIFR